MVCLQYRRVTAGNTKRHERHPRIPCKMGFLARWSVGERRACECCALYPLRSQRDWNMRQWHAVDGQCRITPQATSGERVCVLFGSYPPHVTPP